MKLIRVYLFVNIEHTLGPVLLATLATLELLFFLCSCTLVILQHHIRHKGFVTGGAFE